jgi:hypothetical protein
MSRAEAAVLVQWGKLWLAHMWISGNESKRDELIKHINDGLNVINFKIGRGWQNYDPVIRRAGSRPSTYAQIASWASRQTDSGRPVAQTFLSWASDDATGLQNLPTELQDLAIITHLAEVARGYESALDGQLYPLLQAIVTGNKTWGDYRDFAPSLKYAEDTKMDWSE